MPATSENEKFASQDLKPMSSTSKIDRFELLGELLMVSKGNND